MPTTAEIHFEVMIPFFSGGTSQENAVTTFRTTLEGLGTVFLDQTYQFDSSDNVSEVRKFYGVIVPANASAAQTAFSNLQTAIGSTPPCYFWNVTMLT
jgi:hypothetical protein